TLRGAADAAPDPEPASALRRNRLPYGPEHPLAQGEKLTVSDPHVQVEEVSRRVAPKGSCLFPGGDFGAEQLLRNRLDEEAYRWCAPEWVSYQRALQQMARRLCEAGVPEEQALAAVGELDDAGATLYLAATVHMLDLGLDVGKKIARDGWPSLVYVPGDRLCPACHGAGGDTDDDAGSDCPTCAGTGLVEPGPTGMLIYLPDGLMVAEGAADAA
ncbi:MAG: hypothetical protein KC442_18145, partial [Thermomicrobiales bacterium]|nr:hypothetical protein [Thermomicrobiales bacterium]